MPLNARQSLFVNEYLVDMNATNAAVRAGYSPKTAKSQASRLLTIVNVKAEIQMRQNDDENRLKIDREMVLAKLEKDRRSHQRLWNPVNVCAPVRGFHI